jgi:hypothetical protein
MTTFLFYLCAILLLLTIAAAIADGIGHLFPHLLDPERRRR